MKKLIPFLILFASGCDNLETIGPGGYTQAEIDLIMSAHSSGYVAGVSSGCSGGYYDKAYREDSLRIINILTK